MSKETRYSNWRMSFLSAFVGMLFLLLGLATVAMIFIPIGIIIYVSSFFNLYDKGGYIAGNSGVTFWKYTFFKRHFDYSSIHSVDVGVINGEIRCGSTSFVFIITLHTDKGDYSLYDESFHKYDICLRRDKESKRAILETYDMMKLKKYIEERI